MPATDIASRRTVALLLAGALLPLAGCSSGSEEDSAGGGASGAAFDVQQTDRVAVASGGTLRWAVDALPRTLNVFQPDADAATDRVAGATLPSLFTLDERARPQPDPNFLKSAEVTETEPRQKVVYRLNEKAKWSDGRAIGVADFAAQWKALNGKNAGFWSSRNAGYDRIAKVTGGEGPHTVEVTFAEPYADWKSLFSPLYPKAVTGSVEAFNDGARTSLPVSGGPFAVQKASKGSGTGKGAGALRLVRNPKWWGERAKLDAIELKAVPPEKREAQLASGKLDLAEIESSSARRIAGARTAGKNGDEPAGGPREPGTAGGTKGSSMASGAGAASALHAWADARMSEEAKAEADARRQREARKQAEDRQLRGYTVRKALDPAYTQLALNGASGPLSDERVRRAVVRAIDRNELAKHALRGTGLPDKPLGSHLRMRDQEGYSDNSAAVGGRDVENAQKLLAEAGWSGGGSTGPDQKVAKGDDAKSDEDSGKPGDSADSAGGAARAETKPQAGPENPPHRAEARKAAIPISAAEAKRVAGKPLGVLASGAGQRAALLTQAARARQRAARAEGSPQEVRAAGAELERAQALGKRARELRLLAGGEATAVRMKEGEPLALRFVLPTGPGTEEIRATGERITAMLNGIGVRTQIKKVANESYFRDHIASGHYDLALFSWPASAYPATDSRPIFAKPRARGDGSLAVEQNYTRVGTDQIDRLFEEAVAELDDGARSDLIKRADARIWAAAGSVPLYQRPQLVAAKNKIVNAGAFGFRTPRYQDIGYRT